MEEAIMEDGRFLLTERGMDLQNQILTDLLIEIEGWAYALLVLFYAPLRNGNKNMRQENKNIWQGNQNPVLCY